MSKPTKKKNGKWRVQVYLGKVDGKSIIKTITADTKAECEYKASILKHNGLPKSYKLTVRDAVEKYINSVQGVISYTTLRGYDVILRNYFKKLMDLPIDDLTNTIVQQEISEESQRITKGKKISPKTIQNGWGLISTSLKKVCGVEFDVRLPQQEVKIKEFPDPQEIIEAIKGTSSELPCLLAIWLGMRMEEIKGLDCSSVRDGVIHIEQVRIYKSGKEEIKPTAKNDRSIRNLVLPNYLRSLIENTEEYRNFAETGENVPLIPTPRNRIYKRWKKICSEHNWEMSFHDLRAVNASIGIVLGIPDKYMMQRNGYKSDHTLKQRYQQLITPNRQAVDKIIDDYFNSFLG